MEAINKDIVTEITISYKPTNKLIDRPKVITSAEAYNHIITGFDDNLLMLQEQFVVLYLNQANGVLGVYKASKGGITSTVVDIRIILAIGLKLLATSMIIAHNHPSGNLIPSVADKEITTRIVQAGKLLDIKLLDHLIITGDKLYYSLADHDIF